MYSYTYCDKTGGILLNSTPTGFSKEPRPVYAPELDVLGFDKYWKYDKQSDTPYMWAEANRYFYYGRMVAQLRGGNVYQAPEIIIPNDEDDKPVMPEPKNAKLRPVDIAGMVEANREILGWLEGTTAKRILSVYEKYKDKLDIFHVAFSGGKDSCVLLDLVKRVLPHDSFVVVFGDTGMEFSDTYEVINKFEEQCREEGIKFYRAASHLSPSESWDLFEPPSRVLRWCCSVHKSTPQTLKLREVTGKQNYTGLAYVGVRAEESATRAEYDYENYGKKQKGQYSHNSILEWTSAEVWLYIYSRNVIINEAYKRGSSRVGCICCPMGGGKSSYIEYMNYPTKVNNYFDLIKHSNGRKNISGEDYISNGGWNARKNGRDLSDNEIRYTEKNESGEFVIDVVSPTSSWDEWVKTLSDEDQELISYKKTKNGFIVSVAERLLKEKPLFSRLFRQTAHKAAYCVGCKVCEANCPSQCISFETGDVKISGCLNCHECHRIETGCLRYHSLRHPTGGGKIMRSLNTMSNHAPKTEWFKKLFEKGNGFFTDHGLGPEQISFFKRFLKDAGIAEKNALTDFTDTILANGWDTATAMGLILINLVNENPQVDWYIRNLEIGRVYDRKTVESMLVSFDVKPPVAKSICGAFKRLTETPLGTKLNFGYVDGENLVRTTCSVSDLRVILYALYKFAEKCNDHKEFTLNELLSDNIERDGVSPTRIFGLDREAMIPILLGLSASNPGFINATFTNDLDKISLKDDKTSADVLELFKEGN
jgi:phosphoadenosine phosphosulfate reductase